MGRAGPLRVGGPPVRRRPAGVIVAGQVGDVVASRAALRNAVLIWFPLLLGVLAVIAYFVIGWTLRPVEELRGAPSGSAPGGGGAAEERLPVPQAADEIRALAVTLNRMLDRLAAGRERDRSGAGTTGTVVNDDAGSTR